MLYRLILTCREFAPIRPASQAKLHTSNRAVLPRDQALHAILRVAEFLQNWCYDNNEAVAYKQSKIICIY